MATALQHRAGLAGSLFPQMRSGAFQAGRIVWPVGIAATVYRYVLLPIHFHLFVLFEGVLFGLTNYRRKKKANLPQLQLDRVL